MITRILTFFAFVFLLTSCQEDLQQLAPLTPLDTTESSLDKRLVSTTGAADEILRDARLLARALDANTPQQISAALKWYDREIVLHGTVNINEFVVDHLNVSASLINNIQNYGGEKLDLVLAEASAPEGEGPLYQHLEYVQLRTPGGGGNDKPDCSGWRKLGVLGQIALCATILDDIANLDPASIIEDCGAAGRAVYSYYQDCIK